MEPQPNLENQNLNESTSSNLPSKNIYKILFFLSLGLFLITASVLVTLLITQKSSKPIQTTDIQKTELTPTETTKTETESITPILTELTITPIKPATSSTKTSFQKLIINFSSYKEITTTEKKQFTDPAYFWTGFIKSEDTLYAFAQELIKGSIKKLTISKTNLSTILGNYEYIFYLTPNYQKWTTDQFVKNTESKVAGPGDISPLYASTDKLVWTTSLVWGCGDSRPNDINEQKAQDQCLSLIKEIKTAF